MELKDISKWFWDIAKYVVSAIIISSFLGRFDEDDMKLYIIGFAVVSILIAIGIFVNKYSKKKQK